MQPVPPCPVPTHGWRMRASGLLLCWELRLGTYSLDFVFFPHHLSPHLCCSLRFHNSPQTQGERVYLIFGNLSSTTPSSGWVFVPLFCLSFCLLYFVLPPFEGNRLPFWVPGVLRQRSEVVLWKLLSIQMIFWWICGGESGLPILFLRHLGTAPLLYILLAITVVDVKLYY